MGEKDRDSNMEDYLEELFHTRQIRHTKHRRGNRNALADAGILDRFAGILFPYARKILKRAIDNPGPTNRILDEWQTELTRRYGSELGRELLRRGVRPSRITDFEKEFGEKFREYATECRRRYARRADKEFRITKSQANDLLLRKDWKEIFREALEMLDYFYEKKIYFPPSLMLRRLMATSRGWRRNLEKETDKIREYSKKNSIGLTERNIFHFYLKHGCSWKRILEAQLQDILEYNESRDDPIPLERLMEILVNNPTGWRRSVLRYTGKRQ